MESNNPKVIENSEGKSSIQLAESLRIAPRSESQPIDLASL